MKFSLVILATVAASASAFSASSFAGKSVAGVPVSSSALNMKYKVAVVGGGPAGACAAEIFAQEKGIDTVMFERKMDNAKPCGGAIPLCMVGEFDLPETVVDRKVRFFQRRFIGTSRPVGWVTKELIGLEREPCRLDRLGFDRRHPSRWSPNRDLLRSKLNLEADLVDFSTGIRVARSDFFASTMASPSPFLASTGPQDEPHLAHWCRGQHRRDSQGR